MVNQKTEKREQNEGQKYHCQIKKKVIPFILLMFSLIKDFSVLYRVAIAEKKPPRKWMHISFVSSTTLLIYKRFLTLLTSSLVQMHVTVVLSQAQKLGMDLGQPFPFVFRTSWQLAWCVKLSNTTSCIIKAQMRNCFIWFIAVRGRFVFCMITLTGRGFICTAALGVIFFIIIALSKYFIFTGL